MNCKHCGEVVTKAGQCQYCLKNIGSIPKALLAATVASLALFITWSVVAKIFDAEYSWIAIVVGVFISGSVVWYSKGRGPLFQLIATLFTVLTIFSADLFVTWFLWEGIEIETGPNFFVQLQTLIVYQYSWDPFSWLFSVLGVVGGFYIWTYN